MKRLKAAADLPPATTAAELMRNCVEPICLFAEAHGKPPTFDELAAWWVKNHVANVPRIEGEEKTR